MQFTKWQGCGNDFIIIDFLDSFNKDSVDFSKLAVRLCNRNYGIGADGLMVVLPSDKADFRMRIFNPDGTEPEMCGNGIRCFARYLYDFKLVKDLEFKIETGAGVLIPQIIVENDAVVGVAVDMGEPILEADKIPINGLGNGQAIGVDIKVAGKVYQTTCVSMGNPHSVIFVQNADNFPLAELGHAFETHDMFPNKTNTEFVEIINPKKARMRVWERGAGITLACGTGACAALVAGVLNNHLERQAAIILDGGKLNILWCEDNHIIMSGPAELVFKGDILV